MPIIEKRRMVKGELTGEVFYKAEFRKPGFSKYENFDTRGGAEQFLKQAKAEYKKLQRTRVAVEVLELEEEDEGGYTIADALIKYEKEVTLGIGTGKGKDGWREECGRLRRFASQLGQLVMDKAQVNAAQMPLAKLRQSHFVAWRDARMALVSDGTLLREWAILHNVLIKALEWGWLREDPSHHERTRKPMWMPSQPQERERLPTHEEIEALRVVSGYTGGKPQTKTQTIFLAFRLGCETAMRAREIRTLHRSRINTKDWTVFLPKELTKTKVNRTIPIGPDARKTLMLLLDTHGDTPVPISSAYMTNRFRMMRRAAGLDRPGEVPLWFRDSRAEACTWMAEKMPQVALSKVVMGHKSTEQTNKYYRKSAAEITKMLE